MKKLSQPIIGLDARVSHLKVGIGRYARALVRHLAHKNNLLIFLHTQSARPAGAKVAYTNAVPIRYKEQLAMPWFIIKNKIKLFHSVYHNVPLLPNPAIQLTTVHDLAYDDLPAERATLKGHLAYRVYLDTILKRSVRLIVPSGQVKEAIVKRFSYPASQIHVIPMGVESKFFTKIPEKQAQRFIKQKLNIESPYFLFIGENRPRKNIDKLLKSYARFLKKTKAQVRLVIVSNRDRRFIDIARSVKKLALTDHVCWLELQDDSVLVPLYRGCLAYLHPSLLEGFGITVLEAMATGKAVLASSTGVVPDLPNNSVLTVDPNQVESIALGIQQLWEDKQLRKALAGRGPKVAAQYTWKKTAEQTWEVYDEVLK